MASAEPSLQQGSERPRFITEKICQASLSCLLPSYFESIFRKLTLTISRSTQSTEPLLFPILRSRVASTPTGNLNSATLTSTLPPSGLSVSQSMFTQPSARAQLRPPEGTSRARAGSPGPPSPSPGPTRRLVGPRGQRDPPVPSSPRRLPF